MRHITISFKANNIWPSPPYSQHHRVLLNLAFANQIDQIGRLQSPMSAFDRTDHADCAYEPPDMVCLGPPARQ
jgi:hypothetical protein